MGLAAEMRRQLCVLEPQSLLAPALAAFARGLRLAAADRTAAAWEEGIAMSMEVDHPPAISAGEARCYLRSRPDFVYDELSVADSLEHEGKHAQGLAQIVRHAERDGWTVTRVNVLDPGVHLIREFDEFASATAGARELLPPGSVVRWFVRGVPTGGFIAGQPKLDLPGQWLPMIVWSTDSGRQTFVETPDALSDVLDRHLAEIEAAVAAGTPDVDTRSALQAIAEARGDLEDGEPRSFYSFRDAVGTQRVVHVTPRSAIELEGIADGYARPTDDLGSHYTGLCELAWRDGRARGATATSQQP